jgi:group I intron endonuclease
MQSYIITNKQNGKSYVGITTRKIARRWYEHCYASNSCGQLLNKAINKYGIDAFEIQVVASAKTIPDLKELEKQLIVQYQTKVPNGYNLTDGGDGLTGYRHTEENKRRNGDAKRGTVFSDETKQKMKDAHLGENNHFYGKSYSEETKQRISETKKANPTRYWLGKKRDEETKLKFSLAKLDKPSWNKGLKMTDEARKNMSNAQKGRLTTDETRLKLSLAVKKVWEQRKLNQLERRA